MPRPYEVYIVMEEIDEKQINIMGAVKDTKTKEGDRWG